jgi:DNA-binding beta-propeller fold protein YncE
MSVEEALRSTLQERASALPPGRPDIAALLARGDASRRGRRHRRMVVLAAAAAVVLVLVGVSRLGDPERDIRPTGPPDRENFTPEIPVTPEVPVTPEIPVDAAVLDVGGLPGEYSAIDPAAGLLYVGVMQDEGKLAVVDTTSGDLVDTVDLGAPYGSGGLALDTSRDLLYVALDNPQVAAVAVVSTVTRQVVDTITVGLGPDDPGRVFMGDLVFDPETRSLFATTTEYTQWSQRRGILAIADTDSRTLMETIPVSEGSLARAVALDEDRHAVYVSGRDDQLLVVDTRTRAVVDTIDGVGPSGCLSFDAESDQLFNCNETYGTVTIVDADAREVLTKLVVGGSGPFAVAIDRQAGQAYIDDKLLDLETLEVLGTLRPDLPGSWFLSPVTVDQSTRTAYGWGVLKEQSNQHQELIALAPPTT